MKRRVIVAVDDLFFAAKIRAAAERAGAEAVFVKTAERLLEEAAREGAASVVLDLQAGTLDHFAAARALKADERTRGLPVVGFFPHVQTDLQRRAEEAGVDQVMPRSAFDRRMVEILGGGGA